MELFFQRVDVGFGSVGALHGLQFGVEIFIKRRVGENALLRLQFRLKGFPSILNSLTANAGD